MAKKTLYQRVSRWVRDWFKRDDWEYKKRHPVKVRGRLGHVLGWGNEREARVHVPFAPDCVYVTFDQPIRPGGDRIEFIQKDRIKPGTRLIYGLPVVLVDGYLEWDKEAAGERPDEDGTGYDPGRAEG